MRALYYPHTEITNELVLKSALLLWDEIQTIYPTHGAHRPTQTSRLIREASELVVTHRSPSLEQKHLAQSQLKRLLDSGILHRIALGPQLARQSRSGSYEHTGDWQYRIYNTKFLHETWRMLEREGLARWHPEEDAEVAANVGFVMMSLLADACAGSQTEKVTDRPEAYSLLEEVRAQELGSEVIKNLTPDQVATAYDRLVSISFNAIGTEHIPFERLLALRRKELKDTTGDLRSFRRRYHKILREFLVRIGKEARTASDFKELEAAFKDKMKEDLKDLKAELGLASQKALWSKEIVFSTVAVAGAFVEPISALTSLGTGVGALGIVPLMKIRAEYRAARQQALAKHFSSWVYVANPSPLRRLTSRLTPPR